MYSQNASNNPRYTERGKSGQAGMIMSGMPCSPRIGTVQRSESFAVNSATFNPVTLSEGARIEFIFGLQNRNVVIPVLITEEIATNAIAINAAILAELRRSPSVNGFLAFVSEADAALVNLTATAKFANQPFGLTVQAINAAGSLVGEFATYGRPVTPMSDRDFYNSLLYPQFGLWVAAGESRTDGVQSVKLPTAASDRILGLVVRRDPIMNTSFQPEIREFAERGDIRPWLENYVASSSDQVACRHTVDAQNNRVQLGATVAVPAGQPAPAGCALIPTAFRARFDRVKSDGTATVVFG